MATTKWILDPTHSELQFKVIHLMISTVTGSFNDFSAELTTDAEDFEDSKITFKAGTDSIDTGNGDRDGHLKSGDFFHADQFPSITFESTSFKKEGSDYKLKGDLTIKDITKPVTLDVEFGGKQTDQYGNNKAGFSIRGKFSRIEFGLTWNAALESGGVLVSEDVKILGELQFIKQV